MTKPRGLVFKSNTPKPAYVPLGNPEIEIAMWCPDVEARLPPEEVHLILHLPGLEDMPIVMRFFSPDTLGFLIEELIRYRREVWSDCQTLETELAESNSWTPVSIQLPPDDWILIVVDFHEPYRRRMVLRGYYDPHDHTWRTRQGRIKPHWEVTHWQPLPDLPE